MLSTLYCMLWFEQPQQLSLCFLQSVNGAIDTEININSAIVASRFTPLYLERYSAIIRP